ncbi:similar to Saccharomyces cerevisiae YNL327W EGT2 Glycosylphosphatidylinositol (GPI)-anchored cell wall endoglucanase required for proper cell separation after cytokinesis [Maudiozyma saulgeensis]|uniref:Similar to Saccharomyces cerevisiae YNL327W EGT2 Glycosylphosphatidylinositol (GPI)-anchored cell wall endoglucanase required for proper cell separation after cytokinesis n=1 Tax=Maudiozyma saulgeensis TaxID=1789683 RepID=A0A1X7R1X4_9SACH|nr:similar to Saccharomyces cerevisiae YNL327W EGT2 Glycosylphosphatidylinositol (GPI)-anchored cell wall endoglucanase required for proper cell separation after cytokinesis [Kazachstania saulgeensis]
MKSFSKNILFAITLLLSALSTAIAASVPYFSDVQILDSYTETTDCTDLDHWFIIQPTITIPAQSETSEIQITIPLAFESYSSGSFDLLYGSTTIGTVNIVDGSNTFTVSFNSYVTSLQNEITTNFNVLAKFSDSAKELVNKPMSLSYAVNATDDKTFTPTINFVGTDLTSITTDGGVYDSNNTAWFVINIPISMLDGAVSINVAPTGSNSFYYEYLETTFEVVTAVDAFNNPLSSVPFTAVKDQSTTAALTFNITSNVSGGKYLRISYSTGPLIYDAITNEVTINDNTVFDSTVYTSSMTNVELNSASSALNLDIGLISSNRTTSSVLSKAISSQTSPAASSETTLATSESTEFESSQLQPVAASETLDSLFEEGSSDDTNNSTSSFIVSTVSKAPTSLPTTVETSSLIVNSTSSSVTATSSTTQSDSNAVSIISSSTSPDTTSASTVSPVVGELSTNKTLVSFSASSQETSTTSALDLGSNMTISTAYSNASATTSGNDTYETYTVLKSTSPADVTEITKLVPVATLSGSTISSEVVITSTVTSDDINDESRFINSTSTVNTIANATAVTSTKLSTKVITTTSCSNNLCVLATSTVVSEGYVVTTESCSEDATVLTNLVAVSTLPCTSCIKSETIKSKGYVVNTESLGAEATIKTKLIPVATLSSSTTHAPVVHKTTTLTASVDETVVSYTTESCSTTTLQPEVSVEAGYIKSTETQSASVTSYLDFLGESSITKSEPTSSTVQVLVQSTTSSSESSIFSISYYEAGSTHLSIGLGSFIIGIVTLFI